MTKNLALPRHLLEKHLTDGHFVDEKYKVTRRPTYSRQNASLRRPSIVSGKRQSTKCRSAEWFSTRRRGAKLARSRKTDRKGYPTSFFFCFTADLITLFYRRTNHCAQLSRGAQWSVFREKVCENKSSGFSSRALSNPAKSTQCAKMLRNFSVCTLFSETDQCGGQGSLLL